MDDRLRACSAAVLAGAALVGAGEIRTFLAKVSTLPSGSAAMIRTGLLGMLFITLGAAFVLVFFWRRLTPRRSAAVAAFLFLLLAVAPAIGKTVGRLSLGPQAMILDSALQVEVAADMLVRGKNPYREDYFGTDMERWHHGRDVFPMHHLIYPPLPILMVLPLREACLSVLGLFDARFLLIPAMVIAFLRCWRAWRDAPWGGAFLTIVFLNPLLLPNFHVGRWDTLILLLWILALEAAIRGRFGAMAAALALSAATKTTVLPAALFGVVWACRSRKEAIRWIGIYSAALAIVVLPFLLWDAKAMVEDLLMAPSGRGAYPSPIQDAGVFGIASLVLCLGWVASPSDYFPFWIIQWPMTFAAAAFGVRELLRRRTLAVLGMAYALTAGTMIYFNRFSDPAYFGALLSMVVVATGFSMVGPPAKTSMDPGPAAV